VTVKIGISLPMSSDWVSVTGRVSNGILLAIKEAKPIPGVTLEPYLLDYAASGIAYDQIPVSSKAGLLQCGPSTGWPGLTKGTAAEELRGSGLTSENYLRLKAPDDDQGFAMADYAATTLKVHSAVVIDGGGNVELTQTVDRFVERWGQLPGTSIVARLKLGSGIQSQLQAAARSHPGAVFLAGDEAGAGQVRAAMVKAGLGSVPLLGSGDVAFGDGAKTYFQLAGAHAANTFVAYSYSYDVPDYNSFADRFW
jgi:ABC-type branched-subunit amino acid transport system substrate-binding protein